MFFFYSDFFKIKGVEVIGSSHVSSEALEREGIVPIGVNIWLIKKDAMVFDIEKRWFVKVKSIRRKLPSRLLVDIEDQVPIAFVRSSNGLWFISRRKLVWPVVKMEEALVKKLVQGLCVISYPKGEVTWFPGKETEDEILRKLVDILMGLKGIYEVNVDTDWFSIKMEGYEVLFRRGDNVRDELLKLRKVIERFPFRGRTVVVDLRFDDMAIVRERDR